MSMGLDQLHYRVLRQAVRPGRVATGVPLHADQWRGVATRMIECYSMTWGGAANILVPIDDDGTLQPAFWPLVELFDADLWASYLHTHRGWELCEPEAHRDWHERQARRWARKHGGGIAAAREQLRAGHIMSHVLWEWSPSQEFTEALRRRTGPATERGRLTMSSFQADQPPGQHLVDVSKLAPLPERLVTFDSTGVEPELELLLLSRFGALAPAHRKALEAAGVHIETIPIGNAEFSLLLELAWTGTTDRTLLQLRQALGDHGADHPLHHVEDLATESPAGLSLIGCRRMERWVPNVDDLAVVIVCGSQFADYCFAHALERCGVPSLWLPGELVTGVAATTSKSTLEVLGRCLERSDGNGWGDRPKHLTSLSLTEANLIGIAKELADTMWHPAVDVVAPVAVQLPPHRMPVVLDPLHYSTVLEEPFIGEETVRGIPGALPTAVRSQDPWDLTWWIDVYDPKRLLPARHALNDLVVAETTGWRAIARSGRDAISYYSHTMGFVAGGSPVEQIVERPRLRFPKAETVFKHLFELAGFTVQESPAGRFRRLATAMWGGLDPLAADLSDPRTLTLLKSWLSTERSGAAPGVLTSGSRRRFLTFEDAGRASGILDDELTVLIDRYIERDIVRRGLVLKCPNCLQFDWHALDAVTQSFECGRCRIASRITSATWRGGGAEPPLYYDLAEVVYQAISSDFDVPVRALKQLSDESKSSFAEAPEIEIADTTERTEIDLLVIADGRILLGEAKRSNELGKSARDEVRWLERFRRAAVAATADDVVFATATPAWSERTARSISGVFGDRDRPPRLLVNC